TVRLVADNGSTTVEDEFTYVVNPAVNTASLPTLNSKLGVNYLSSTSVRLVLHAPLKNYVYVLGTFNDFTPDVNYFMNRTPSGDTWWIDITGLTAGETYAFQYFVDGEIKVADPFSELILDPSNDSNIEDPETFPNLPAYPENASGALTVITPGATPYNWQIDNFQRPDKEDLVIYELLVRDFIDAHDYDTLLDSLDYLANLGVNAIQFMPIQEFEGNISWGYNPSFHMAVDKYYGTPDQLKAFIDACHTRGIAVILDVVFNHVFSQSPLAQLWWNSAGFRPATNNPYLNEYATHPFNVGYDVNHETQAAKDWMDRVVQHWITEYRFDGFRFDLSKGFTQVQSCNNTGGACNVGFWSSYDQSRIDLLTRLYDETVAVDDVYMILEHLADNSEEIVLANYGYMLWGNGNVNYNQATMGYDNSNFDYASNYQARGWNDPHLVSYMESHDEQRLMYRNLEFGNSNGNYDVTNLATALDRVELATAFFYSIPGPKMLWQFGEVGYDFPINYCPDGSIQEPCRVDPKPIRWDYFQDPDRRDLYDMTSQMIKLKTNLEVFSTTNYTLDLSNDFTKRIHLNGSDRNITVLGNFDVVGNNNFVPNFQNTGWWYEYFSGDSILVSNTQAPLSFGPGEYRLYSDVRIDPSDVSTSIFAPQITNAFELNVFPNPTVSKGQINLSYHLPEGGRVIIELFDAFGRKVTNLVNQQQASGNYQLPIDLNQQELAPGLYLIRITHNQQQGVRKLLVSPE
ncbi:MAG: alpha-amylase family glycosyl hydrolase, partial [Bacteroidota bacterium]